MARVPAHPFHVGRLAAPPLLAAAALRRRATPAQRVGAVAGLLGVWTAVWVRYRRRGRAETEREWRLLATSTREAFERHYNECVPTVEEEFEIWGDYHAYRHEMRYDLVAEAVRRHVPPGGTVLDVGCGAALVADRIADLSVRYVGVEYGRHQVEFARDKARTEADSSPPPAIRRSFVQADAEHLPLADGSVDVVVMSEVIEHLLRPELAVWEVARVLRVGGVFVMTTNNASEMPLFTPSSHLFPWLEKAVGFHHDSLISHRPWVWPEPVSKALLPDGAAPVYVPHTWHKQAETRRMFAAAGLRTFHASTFEFPPPQSRTSQWLSHRGRAGTRVVDAIEAVCTRVPLLDRLGCHVLMLASREPGGLPAPPPGVWPGPFSTGAAQSTSVR
jgi:2-polyprenyl-6-hydroxyphenyl methylase/3-demethylubiquinone-9 3-methyltransferase